jgi:lysophospholipase L1-like esterase
MGRRPQRKGRRLLPASVSELALVIALAAAFLFALAPPALADSPASSDSSAIHYYVSLGDSLAASFQPNGDFGHGYAEQLYADLKARDPKLELVKLGCFGESTSSMRFGSQPQEVVVSCGGPRLYKSLYPKGAQLAEAISFLRAHKSKVALVTIDIGANDLSRVNAQGNSVSCLFEFQGCAAQKDRIVENLSAILGELQAADPGVPIVGMTYDNVFAALWFTNPVTALFVDGRVADLNAAEAATYTALVSPLPMLPARSRTGCFPTRL